MSFKRRLTNIGLNQAMVYQDDTVMADVEVEFTIVSLSQKPAATFDVPTGKYVAPLKKTAVISATGEIDISLWCTSRGQDQRLYLVEIPSTGERFLAPMVEGEDPISWVDFRLSGEELAESELSAFAVHLQDYLRHLTAEQTAALAAAHNPSAGNPLATMQDVSASGGAVSATDVLYGLIRMSVAAVDPNDPIAVGDNDERLHTHGNQTTLNKISEAEELPLWKNGPWPGGGLSSGHTIIDPVGNAVPQRSKLKVDFDIGGNIFAVSVQDDAENDTTIILFTFPDVFGGGNF
jgi:hypothetical protein